MRNLYLTSLLTLASCFGLLAKASPVEARHWKDWTPPIAPKVFIISMFTFEADVWYGIPEFNLFEQNITIPGLSPLFPAIHCTGSGEICQIIIGEAEINAAASISALVYSPRFDLTKTYFMVAGIAGISPEIGTLASVTFAKYAVQVALQYEFDYREVPSNFTTGYVPFGVDSPDEYPLTIYGTEAFEVSENLRDIALSFASAAVLNDSVAAQTYRALYAPAAIYAAATKPPSLIPCDVATSDVYYSGTLLSEAFANTTRLFTNGSGVYCTTAQEDNATLEVFVRSTLANLTDFARIIIMRTASDFDRPPPGITSIQNLFYVNQGGFPPSLRNIYLAGVKIVEGILDGWDSTFDAGIEPGNYIGDIFGTLGGTPDFGQPAPVIGKRALQGGFMGNNRMQKKQEAWQRAAMRAVEAEKM